MANIIKFFEIN